MIVRRVPTVVVAGLILFIQLACADEKTEMPDFSRYPQTRAYKAAFDEKDGSRQFQEVVDSAFKPRVNFLSISALSETDGFSLEYSVSERGEAYSVRAVYNFALEASHSKQLSKDEIKALHLAIERLPPKNVYPPVNHLVIVRFLHGTTWIVRCYDNTNLPKAMQDIYAIIGEKKL
jgi:hypothetical protein